MRAALRPMPLMRPLRTPPISDVMAMTAAMPMTMPRTASKGLRPRLASSERIASRIRSMMLIAGLDRVGRSSSGREGGCEGGRPPAPVTVLVRDVLVAALRHAPTTALLRHAPTSALDRRASVGVLDRHVGALVPAVRRIWTARSASAATPGSCVMSTMVLPGALEGVEGVQDLPAGRRVQGCPWAHRPR